MVWYCGSKCQEKRWKVSHKRYCSGHGVLRLHLIDLIEQCHKLLRPHLGHPKHPESWDTDPLRVIGLVEGLILRVSEDLTTERRAVLSHGYFRRLDLILGDAYKMIGCDIKAQSCYKRVIEESACQWLSTYAMMKLHKYQNQDHDKMYVQITNGPPIVDPLPNDCVTLTSLWLHVFYFTRILTPRQFFASRKQIRLSVIPEPGHEQHKTTKTERIPSGSRTLSGELFDEIYHLVFFASYLGSYQCGHVGVFRFTDFRWFEGTPNQPSSAAHILTSKLTITNLFVTWLLEGRKQPDDQWRSIETQVNEALHTTQYQIMMESAFLLQEMASVMEPKLFVQYLLDLVWTFILFWVAMDSYNNNKNRSLQVLKSLLLPNGSLIGKMLRINCPSHYNRILLEMYTFPLPFLNTSPRFTLVEKKTFLVQLLCHVHPAYEFPILDALTQLAEYEISTHPKLAAWFGQHGLAICLPPNKDKNGKERLNMFQQRLYALGIMKTTKPTPLAPLITTVPRSSRTDIDYKSALDRLATHFDCSECGRPGNAQGNVICHCGMFHCSGGKIPSSADCASRHGLICKSSQPWVHQKLHGHVPGPKLPSPLSLIPLVVTTSASSLESIID